MRKDQIENPWHEQRLNYMFKPKEIKEKEKKRLHCGKRA